MSKKDSEKAVAAVFDSITETLVAGEKVQIVGFGGFETKMRAPRVGRNPRTNAQMQIESSRGVTFKAGKTLKDAVK